MAVKAASLLLCGCLSLLHASSTLSDSSTDPEATVGNLTLSLDNGLFSSLLEDWAVGHTDRQERILQIPNTSGYYISNRVDAQPTKPSWSQELGNSSSSTKSSPGKILNNPGYYNNAYQKPRPGFVPSPADPMGPNGLNQGGHISNGPGIGTSGYANTASGTGSPGRKEVSETDLYLLGAIEKLVYRVDFMEKRLKKAEELIYYIMSGSNKKNEPCTKDFTRVGQNCYQFSTLAPGGRELDWKEASVACRARGAVLAEMETIEENQDVVSFIQASQPLRGKDYWTGGLNPGLLWIWSNSARPVATGKGDKPNNVEVTNAADIKGNGRCLKLAFSPPLRTYSYLGHDCSKRQHYICEIGDKSISNEIQRISRQLNFN